MTCEERYAQGIYLAGLEKVTTTTPPKVQKYPPGTRVRITGGNLHNGKLPYNGKLATVQYTHAHACGGDDVKSYSLFVDGMCGSSSWYDESILAPMSISDVASQAMGICIDPEMDTDLDSCCV